MEPSDQDVGSDVLETAPEQGDDGGAGPTVPVLVYVGCAEDDFAHAGRTLALAGVDRVRLGRSTAPGVIDVVQERGVMRVGVPTMWCSSAHAELTLGPSGAPVEQELRDLGSRNGTMVDGSPIRDVVALAAGQIIEIGRSFWMVRRHAAPIPDDEHVDHFDTTGTASPAWRHTQRALARLAGGNVPILLIGETGTGKEFVARAIHRASGRVGPFVRATLAGAPEARVDTLLFGGTDAGGEPGLIDRARGGTLFIDDVSTLSREAQSKLLWALAEHAAFRSDGDAGVRMLACSLRELEPMVSAQRFRADLYSRLAGFEARLPALRERREDLGLLLRALLRRADGTRLSIDTPALRRLLDHAWPFNVRELEQVITAAASVGTGGDKVTRSALDDVLRPDAAVPPSADGIRAMRQELVRQLVAFDGDTASVAENFGVDTRQIERWLERFDIEPDQYRGLS